MTKKSEQSPMVRGSSAVDMLRKRGIDIDSLSEGSASKEIVIDTAKQIRTMRKKAGLSQKELARKANMAQADISRIESGLGKQGPSIETIHRLAQACLHDCSLSLTPTVRHDEVAKRVDMPAEHALFIGSDGVAIRKTIAGFKLKDGNVIERHRTPKHFKHFRPQFSVLIEEDDPIAEADEVLVVDEVFLETTEIFFEKADPVTATRIVKLDTGQKISISFTSNIDVHTRTEVIDEKLAGSLDDSYRE